jgi:hypothetical protein
MEEEDDDTSADGKFTSPPFDSDDGEFKDQADKVKKIILQINSN